MDWTPIRFVHRNYRRDELAGVYRAARVCLVTPLRDGMNLVAKEFVAAQDPDDPGVLVLSRFAGAARQMSEAVIVNPFSREEVSEGLKRALRMERAERIARWRALMSGVVASDVNSWRDDFVSALRAAHEPGLPLFATPKSRPAAALRRTKVAAPPPVAEVGLTPLSGLAADPRLA